MRLIIEIWRYFKLFPCRRQGIFTFVSCVKCRTDRCIWTEMVSEHLITNECNSVSNHMHFDCLFNRLFRHKSKRTLIRALRHWPLWGESTIDRWIPLTKSQLRGTCFHLMTSSCWAKYYSWIKLWSIGKVHVVQRVDCSPMYNFIFDLPLDYFLQNKEK